jgi:hypothetical protein
LKKIKIAITGLLLSSATWAMAQTAPPALDATPPALEAPLSKPEEDAGKTPPAAAPFVRKPQFSLAMGSQFSRFGQAAFVQPTLSFPVTPRFQAFASVQFLHTFGPSFYRVGAEGSPAGLGYRGQTSYVVLAGGHYALTEKLNITGSLWRDLSQLGGNAPQPLNLFSPAGTQGMTLRAHYKVNDRFSVSGGVRYGNGRGYAPYGSSFYHDYSSPFGY